MTKNFCLDSRRGNKRIVSYVIVSATPNSQAEITILRDGKHKTLTGTIGKQDKNMEVAAGSAQSTDEIGITVQSIQC